jgi:hypothetical protein
MVRVQPETQASNGRERIGHQTFAAGLVDGGASGIRHYHVESFETRRDSRR